MARKKYTIDPVGHGVKFKFDDASSKDFGGMVIDRKVTIDAINKRQRPVFANKPRKGPSVGPSGGVGPDGKRGPRNKKMNIEPGPGGRGASRYRDYVAKKKAGRKLPPIISDPRFKG